MKNGLIKDRGAFDQKYFQFSIELNISAVFAFYIRTMKPPCAKLYDLNEEKYRQFPEENNCFFRALYDKDFSEYNRGLRTNMTKLVDSGEPGFSRVDLALYAAVWTVDRHFPFAQEWNPKHAVNEYIPKEVAQRPPDTHSKSDLTHYIKHAAHYFGACKVGITKIDPHWYYESEVKIPDQSTPIRKSDLQKQPFPIPEDINNAIVIAIEMDPKGICNAPNFLEVASSGWAYSQMAVISATLAQFIRNLGYTAIPLTNDVALSIPLAIDAGLGALGRNGLLLTREWGPRVRLCKVLTNMPLERDAPDVKFIEQVNNFCRTCLRCAEACEAKAISFAENPDTEIRCTSNNPGVRKWYVDTNACYGIWVKYSTDCGKCIQVCPFSRTPNPMTPEEFWNDTTG